MVWLSVTVSAMLNALPLGATPVPIVEPAHPESAKMRTVAPDSVVACTVGELLFAGEVVSDDNDAADGGVLSFTKFNALEHADVLLAASCTFTVKGVLTSATTVVENENVPAPLARVVPAVFEEQSGLL